MKHIEPEIIIRIDNESQLQTLKTELLKCADNKWKNISDDTFEYLDDKYRYRLKMPYDRYFGNTLNILLKDIESSTDITDKQRIYVLSSFYETVLKPKEGKNNIMINYL